MTLPHWLNLKRWWFALRIVRLQQKAESLRKELAFQQQLNTELRRKLEES